MTTKEIIIKLLKNKRRWVASYDLCKIKTEWGYIGTSGDRRARDLRKDGILESKEARDIKGTEGRGDIVFYRIKR